MKYIHLFIYCFFLLPVSLFSKQAAHDKVEAKARVANDHPEADEAAAYLFSYYHNRRKLDSAAIFARKTVDYGKQRDSTAMWLEGYTKLAVIHMDRPQIDSAQFYYNLILDETESSEDPGLIKIRARVLMFLGAMYEEHNLGSEQAFLYFKQARELSEAVGYSFVYVRTTVVLIQRHVARRKFDEVPKLFDEAYQFLTENESVNLPWFLLMLDQNKAEYYTSIAISEEERMAAMDLHLKAYNDADSLEFYKARTTIFITLVEDFVEDLPKKKILEMAEFNYQEAKNVFVGAMKGGLLHAYGIALMHNGQYLKAIPLLTEAKNLLKDNKHMDNYLNVCDDLISAYDLTGQREKIKPVFEDYQIFQDSFVATVYSDKLLDLEEKYETEKKENENVQLLAQNDIIQTRFKFSSIIGLLLLAGLAASIYFFLRLRKNKEELERINDGKNRLFAIVAHDLKGPAGAFTDLSESVSYLLSSNQIDRLMELTEYYENAGKKLSYTLTNLLDWAISQKDNFVQQPQTLDVKTEVDNIIAELDYNLAKKELTIENNISSDQSIFFDKDAFKVILRNLLHNSIKFSYKESSITVDFSNKGLQVSDYGIGMDIETKQKILSKQLVASKRGTSNESGSGIGLSTCMKLAEQNNAQLQIESKKGKSTVFTLTAPRAN